MRPSLCQSCVACLLKFLNYLQIFVGISVILYSLWVLNHWHLHGLAFDLILNKLPAPWFVCWTMGVGVLICLIAFTGHIAAEAVNGCCLCFYAILTTILILLEAVLVGDLVFNKHWEEDLPHDATGELRRLRAFVEANTNICKGVVISVVVIQAVSLLVAMVLRGMLQPTRVDYDSDEDFTVVRRPLLIPQGDLSTSKKFMKTLVLHG